MATDQNTMNNQPPAPKQAEVKVSWISKLITILALGYVAWGVGTFFVASFNEGLDGLAFGAILGVVFIIPVIIVIAKANTPKSFAIRVGLTFLVEAILGLALYLFKLI